MRKLRLPNAERAEQLLPRVLAATIVGFTFGSSSFLPLLYLGRLFRWPLFLVLAFLAFRWVAARAPRPRLPLLLTVFAGALVFLALVSFGWTVRPILTFGRSVSLGILFATAAALSIGSVGRPGVAHRLLQAMLAAAVVVSALGLLLLAGDRSAAVQPASQSYPARYRGVGENPNTVPLLLAVVLPIALWLLAGARTRRARLLLAGVVLVFVGSIAAAGARGALAGALVGSVIVALTAPRGWARRTTAVGLAVAIAAGTVGLMAIPQAKNASGGKHGSAAGRDAERVLPLDAEIGRGPLDRPRPPVHRSLLGSSGRGQAWRGAVNQAVDRPLLGYGFGTEASVFTDRFYYFYSATPENTFLGAFLQLGALGLALFAALVLSVLSLAVRALRAPPPGERELIAVTTAIFTGAIVMAVAQTYLLAVGNLATAPVWICGFLAAAASARSRPSAVVQREQR